MFTSNLYNVMPPDTHQRVGGLLTSLVITVVPASILLAMYIKRLPCHPRSILKCRNIIFLLLKCFTLCNILTNWTLLSVVAVIVC